MTMPNRTSRAETRQATSEDIRHVLGPLEDVTLAEILSVQPTYRDLCDAARWARRNGDPAVRERRELGPSARAVAEILAREDEEIVDERD